MLIDQNEKKNHMRLKSLLYGYGPISDRYPRKKKGMPALNIGMVVGQSPTVEH